MLVGAAAAGRDIELRALRGAGVGVVEAQARCRIYQRAVRRYPHLIGAAVTGVDFYLWRRARWNTIVDV